MLKFFFKTEGTKPYISIQEMLKILQVEIEEFSKLANLSQGFYKQQSFEILYFVKK